MTLGGFPAAKLVMQLCRQFTKPLSNSIIDFAKRHPTFRQHLLITPGRYYHWCDTMMRTYLRTDRFSYGLKKAEIIKPKKIEESKAMEVGAQLMLESLVFAILAAFVVYESSKSAAKSQLLEATREQDFAEIVRRKNDLSHRLEHQTALIQELRSRIHNYSTEVGYTLLQPSEIVDDRDIPSSNSDNST